MKAGEKVSLKVGYSYACCGTGTGTGPECVVIHDQRKKASRVGKLSGFGVRDNRLPSGQQTRSNEI